MIERAETRPLKLVSQLVAHLHVTLVHVTAALESVKQQLYFNDKKLDANVFVFPELEGNDLNSL